MAADEIVILSVGVFTLCVAAYYLRLVRTVKKKRGRADGHKHK